MGWMVLQNRRGPTGPPVVAPVVKIPCMNHETRSTNVRMAICIDFWYSTVNCRKHIMTMKAVECVGEIV